VSRKEQLYSFASASLANPRVVDLFLRTVHAVSRPAAKCRIPLFAGSGVPALFDLGAGRLFRTKLFERLQRPQKTVREGFGKNVGKQRLQSTANLRFGTPCSRRSAEFPPPVPTLRIFHHVAPAQNVVQNRADVANTAPS
jgi:hypothetical protein